MIPMSDYARQNDLSGTYGAFMAASGLYWYAANYHGGQSSELYRILSTLGYGPGASERAPEPDSAAEGVYLDLEAGTLEPADVHAWIKAELARVDPDVS